eukprot:6676719-Pyramimonas_sp.AAC.1
MEGMHLPGWVVSCALPSPSPPSASPRTSKPPPMRVSVRPALLSSASRSTLQRRVRDKAFRLTHARAPECKPPGPTF